MTQQATPSNACPCGIPHQGYWTDPGDLVTGLPAGSSASRVISGGHLPGIALCDAGPWQITLRSQSQQSFATLDPVVSMPQTRGAYTGADPPVATLRTVADEGLVPRSSPLRYLIAGRIGTDIAPTWTAQVDIEDSGQWTGIVCADRIGIWVQQRTQESPLQATLYYSAQRLPGASPRATFRSIDFVGFSAAQQNRAITIPPGCTSVTVWGYETGITARLWTTQAGPAATSVPGRYSAGVTIGTVPVTIPICGGIGNLAVQLEPASAGSGLVSGIFAFLWETVLP